MAEVVPQNLDTKLRKVLAFKRIFFESLLVELTLPKTFKEHLMKFPYDTKKLFYQSFQEQSVRSIDEAIAGKETKNLIGIYTINFSENQLPQIQKTITNFQILVNARFSRSF